MKFLSYFRRARSGFLALISILASGVSVVAQEFQPGITAEIWPLEDPVVELPRRALEILRSQPRKGEPAILALDKLEIPAQERPSLVRVRGMLSAPESNGKYEMNMHFSGQGAAELWMQEGKAGAWRLVAGDGHAGGVAWPLEKGKPQRFELWTMGTGKASVTWRASKPEPGGKRGVIVDGIIAGSHIASAMPAIGSVIDDGLAEDWKRRWGVNLLSTEGPDGPWGDPDGDGLLNWQEQMVGSDPKKPDAAGRAGLATWEIWRNLPGELVSALTQSPAFAGEANETRYLTQLQTPTGYGKNYGSRVRALITPPVSGEYTFMLIANATAELWLSDNESSHGARLIAHVEVPGRRGRFVRERPEQISAEIKLEKGKSYYVEVVHKQALEDDHCAVGWVLPGKKSPEIIGGSALRAATVGGEAKDVEILPEDWLAANGLQAADAAKRGPHADPDGDGLTNLEEWRAGTHPLKHDVGGKVQLKNRLTCELWDGFPGKNIRDLARSGGFPGRPSRTSLVDELVFSDQGDSYGCRLRGFITAPEDGSYSFQLTGDRASLLYLSESQDKFTKRLVAETVDSPEMKKYFRAHQSEGIALEKGKEYYIEVLFKRDKRVSSRRPQGDRPSVTWKRPGKSWYNLIAAEYLTPYQPDNRDADDDGLPDDWEQAHGLNARDGGGDNGPWGDPDGDGLTNFREFQAGTDPSKANPIHGVPGYAQWEYWENIRSSSRRQTGLEALKSNAAFPLKPTERDWVIRLEGLPEFGEFYGSRLRAYVIPPVTGDYRFAIAGDNECELWLSDSDLKYYRTRIASVRLRTAFRDWFDPKEPKQMSSPVRLEAGKRYYIEALHHQAEDGSYLSVAWKVPGKAEFEVIEGKALAAFDRDPNDVDDDDLPDDWERANGLPTNQASGDQDLDGDGLSNREEFRIGTRADLTDTDGDGVSDNDELKFYLSNPLVKDVAPPVKLAELPLVNNGAKQGIWSQMPNGTLKSMSRNGAIDFSFNLEKSGIHMVELQAAAVSTSSYVPPIPVIASVNGVEVGRAEINAGGSRHRWLTAWLPAGTHKVTIDNRNVRTGLALEISSVTIFAHEGVDANGDGMPDWLAQLLKGENRFAVVSSESAISPACLEGTARFPGDVQIASSAGEVKTHSGLTGQWFANVPLDPAGDTKITGTFEHGAFSEEHSIRWTATNIYAVKSPLRVRVGDSLKLIAVQPVTDADASTVEYTGDIEVLGKRASGEPLIVKFDKPGIIKIAAKALGGSATPDPSIEVEVIEADFGPEFSIAAGSPRAWDLPKVPHSLVIEADPDLTLEEMDRQPPKSRRFTVSYPDRQSGSPRVLARLGKDGPIVSSTSINAFWFAPASVTGDANLVEIQADGTRVMEVRYVVNGRIPADFSVSIQFMVTDAVFANGDTWHQIKAADFDANGEVRLRMYKAPGSGVPFICHWIRPFFNDHFAD